MKDFEKYFGTGPGEDKYPSSSGLPENGPGMTERAHEIMSWARDLTSVVRTLRAVNMDRMADEIELTQVRITMLAGEIPGIVNKELDASIAHGQAMIGGLLGVAMKMGDQAGEIERLKKNQT